ncbi:MAG: AAA family ATPase [Candidatus Bathyarchaeum sp.]|nr:MAG: AAA family ATPase [Candidatus Bathyarchaeum sp.]
MSAGKALAFHSYKGGTGKTTIATNLAAFYAKIGMRVCLLDCDLYAPSLTTYFRKTPESYINNLLAGEAEISDILVDVSSELGLNGKLLLGFSSPRKVDIHEIEIRHDMKWQLAALRRFLAAKKELFSEYKLDYVFFDTSPGIRYWSVNCIAAADFLFLTMRASDMDIEGTKKMIKEVYESLTKFGSKCFVILNKVPGASPIKKFQEKANERVLLEKDIEKSIGIKVTGSIPCFCDVQFNKHEFLSAINQPKHRFSKNLRDIANKINGMNQRFQVDEE